MDNTSVNLGKRNSIMTRVHLRNSSIYIMGCPCHIVHNVAMKASENFSKVSYLIANLKSLYTFLIACY